MKNLTVQSALEYLKKQGFEVDTSRKLLVMPASKSFGIHTLGVMDFLILKTKDRNHGYSLVASMPKTVADNGPRIPASIEDY